MGNAYSLEKCSRIQRFLELAVGAVESGIYLVHELRDNDRYLPLNSSLMELDRLAIVQTLNEASLPVSLRCFHCDRTRSLRSYRPASVLRFELQRIRVLHHLRPCLSPFCSGKPLSDAIILAISAPRPTRLSAIRQVVRVGKSAGDCSVS